MAYARRAIQLAPSSADVADIASHILAPSGYPEEPLAQSEKATALSQIIRPFTAARADKACGLAGHTEEAIAAFKAYNASSPGFGLLDLVILHQENGLPDEEKQTAKSFLKARRDFTVTSWLTTQFRSDKARLKADAAALRAAGLPMG